MSYCWVNNAFNTKMINRLTYLFLFGLLLVIAACSTEKNTLVSRSYHGMTAHYNGYFNATELLRQSMGTYKTSLKEDFYNILPIDPLPNKEEVIGMYPAIDTAIVKCTKVIQKHSMPSNDKPAQKKEEHNEWIDENWITIGQAQFYRREYDGAMKNFLFVKKFYSNDPSIFVAELWMAKTNIELGKYTEAGFNIANIDKALEQQNSKVKEPKAKKKSKKSKEPEPAEVPKKMLFDLHKTKAELSLRKGETDKAIAHLITSLEFAKKSTDKARVLYVMAQLYESIGNNTEAKTHYTKVLKYNAPYEMSFNARLKRAFMGGDEKVEKELQKMLRDAKNAEFKDQIYYALADIEMQKGNTPKTKEYLTFSAFYSTTNNRQKGMSYERLGNLSYSERNYVGAQKYYDSCSKVITDNYPNAEAIRNKAAKLADLVVAVETAYYEDSVQRIAKMSEDDRVAFIEKVIKQIKEDEKRRKEADAKRLRELQDNQNNFVQNSGNGNKWYFNNPKTRTEGYDEFKKLWGSRENEDDWRRTDKTSFIITVPEGDSAAVVEEVVEKDSLTVEMLLANVPLSDSAMEVSTDRLLDALYVSGIIYKEQLNEPELAKKQFKAVRTKELICETDMSSSYQLYKMQEGTDAATVEKDHILANYTNSDYANYLRDPNFFVKRKEMEALAVQDYVTVLERYNRGVYYPVLSKAETVITSEKENPYRAKYMLLKAMCMGQMNADKTLLLPVLNQLVAEYPATDESKRAQEMIAIINNGYSKNIEVDFNKKSIYTYNDKAEHWVIIFLDKTENSGLAKTKVSDFTKEFFSREKLKVSTKIYGDDQSVILVQDFKDDMKAKEFERVYKATRKHLLDLQKAKTLVITQDNMRTLFETRNLAEYEIFLEEYY
jgi:tetratricopeptide (TPR) repeat protein